ncbi:MAG: DsbA family protein [Patescibacteria group bacterium]
MSILDKLFNEEKDWSIPASILLGSIIIAISISVGANKIAGGSPLAKGAVVQGQQNLPAEKVDLEDRLYAPSIGKGKVEVVEFTDFQCPFCQKFFEETYTSIKAKYIDTGKVKFIVRHFPLSFHKNAQKASEAAECAHRQGRFFPYHDILFSKGQSDGAGLDIVDLKKYASDLGLDTAKFNKCLDNGEAEAAVKQDFDAGNKAGVSGTPTFFINGKRVVGALPLADFEKELETALK